MYFNFNNNDIIDKFNFDNQVNKLIYSLSTTLHIVAPYSIKYLKKNIKNKPWLNNDIINLIKKQESAYKIAKVTNQTADKAYYKAL